MKPSDTRTGISTTGLGQRLDPPPDPWFLARVTTAAVSGGHNVYDLTEVWPDLTGYGYIDKPGGLVVTDAVAHTWDLNDALLAVGTNVLARFRAWNASGATYEIVTSGSGDTSFWAEITGSSGGAEPATTYSWKKKVLSASTHLFVDASPGVTGTNTLKRAPSVASAPPVIPTGHVVRVWPSPTDVGKFECGATGGRQAVTVVTAVACVGGELSVTTKTATAVDLTIA